MKAQRIEIEFPFAVNIDSATQQKIDELVSSICKKNTPAGQVMWPAGSGQKPLNADMTQWDENVYYVEVFARDASPEELRRELETH